MVADEQLSSLLARADLYQDRDDASALFEVAHKLIAGWPEEKHGYKALAAAHSLQGAHKSAIRAMRDALAQDPGCAYSLYWLGVYLGQSGDFVAAESAIRNSLQRDPEYPWSWIELSRLCLATLDKVGAERYARHALALEPENVTARRELASVLASHNEHHNALQVLTDALGLEPENADVWDARAQSFLALKRVSEAEASAREALRLRPNDEYFRSTLYRCIRAQSWVRRALLWPGTASAWLWNAIDYQEPEDEESDLHTLLFFAAIGPIIVLWVLWLVCRCTLLVLYELFTRPYVRRRALGLGAASELLYAAVTLPLAAGTLYAIYWALGTWADWSTVAVTFVGAFALLMVWGEWEDARSAKRAQVRQHGDAVVLDLKAAED